VATLRHSQSVENKRPPHREPSQKTTSGLLPPRLKTVRIDWANLKQWGSIEKMHPPHLDSSGTQIWSAAANVKDGRNWLDLSMAFRIPHPSRNDVDDDDSV